MARSLRLESEGAFYHITSRGNLRDRIFFDDKDKETYLIVISRYIHLNPVRARMVENPADYRWTNYREYIGTCKGKESMVVVSITAKRKRSY